MPQKKGSIPVGKMSEKVLTELVKKSLRSSGWMVAHFHDSRREVKPGIFIGDSAAKGFPDIVATKKERLLVAELKSEKGKFRELQQEWLESFIAIKAEVFLWRPEHWNNGAITQIATMTKRPDVAKLSITGKDYGFWEPEKWT